MFEDLVAKGWVKRTRTPDGLNVYKYAKRVFFKNLWKQDSRLLEARGIVLDDDNNIVQYPFSKTFNLFENDTLVPRDLKVVAVRKVNGFLGVATIHKGELLVSTTGSTISEFAAMARKYLDKPAVLKLLRANSNRSFMFEICDPSDQHIVPEKSGAYLIGCRDKVLGSPLYDEAVLDSLLETDPDLAHDLMRPEIYVDVFDTIRERLKLVKHEGYIIRDFKNEAQILCKIKSRHYLSKKAIMRLGKGKVEEMWANPDGFKQRLDEEFYQVYDHILSTYNAEAWQLLKDTERRVVIENFFAKQAE